MFSDLANELLDEGVCDIHKTPLGQERPDWPEWTKPPISSGRPRVLGCVEFIGDEPYTEPTPRQLDVFKDFPLDGQVIRLKSESVRKAIQKYLAPEVFYEQWLPDFTRQLHRPVYFWTIWDALDRIPYQFNLRPPDRTASDDFLKKYLLSTPNVARYALSFASNQRYARDHPELVLALTMFQASHTCYLEQVYGSLDKELTQRRLAASKLVTRQTDEQWANIRSVIEGPFTQFNDFMIFSTLLPLTLLKLKDITQTESGMDYPQRITSAIEQAWDTFVETRILRREFEDGGRMICPANQHLRQAKDRQVVEGLFDIIYQSRASAPIIKLLARARQVATIGSHWKASSYMLGLADAVKKNENARGGKGLSL